MSDDGCDINNIFVNFIYIVVRSTKYGLISLEFIVWPFSNSSYYRLIGHIKIVFLLSPRG